MNIEHVARRNSMHESTVTEKYLASPGDDQFSDLFHAFTPQLVAFFRARGCSISLAEDLAQDVMLAVHLKSTQIRDRALFRSWLFKVARNAMCRHYGRQTHDVETVELHTVVDRLASGANPAGGTPAFEFREWLDLLSVGEREVMSLRFIEEWEYHEIAAAQSVPIGTVQWRVHNAKRKLALHLKTARSVSDRAA